MWISRIWLVLLALVAAVCAALAILVRGVSAQDLKESQIERLHHAQDNAHLLLKVNIRSWIDEAEKLSRDTALADAAQAYAKASSEEETAAAGQNAATLLEPINTKIKADLLVLVDARGKIVARLGADSKTLGDGVVGYPLVEQALRGYVRDDTWAVAGEMYRMAGAAIPSRSRDQVAGGLLMGKRVDDGFAESMKERLGVDVAFFLEGKVVAKSLGAAVVFAIPSTVAEHRSELNTQGHTQAFAIDTADSQYRVILAQMVGEAAAQEAHYALLTERTPRSVTSFWRRIQQGESLQPVSLAILGISLLAAVTLGFLFFYWEIERPFGRLQEETRDLASGVSGKINDARLRGQFGSVGRSVNQAMERISKTRAERRDISAILDRSTGSDAMAKSTMIGRPTGAASTPPSTMTATLPPQRPGATTSTPKGVRSLAPPIPSPPRDSPAAENNAARTPPTTEPPVLVSLPPSVPADDPTVLMAQAAILEQDERGVEGVDEVQETHFQQVYRDFSDLKRKCGDVDSVSFERFASKLRDNRRQLMQRLSCKDVKFVVYMKDGKAAVKASPIKA